ncbi:carboxymuconolactone decarboxylase family protein [Teredinibacter haidensis]|uniref:carboxymuconolactone decarboxylase family protein n=1 Tax=Teredinibacter haidensis TaxID=2731755 RepID=UPI00094895ED|nr:carboxymuconolactone decarboxylase family protein [Teredinibacter haidensis]
MSNMNGVNYEQEIPDILAAMASVHQVVDIHGLDRSIHHLVPLRASQINRCSFCIKMHTKEALRDNETNERLERVVIWNQVNIFSAHECAALAWTEALTVLDPQLNLGLLRAQLRDHFSEKEIGALTSTIAMINLWNRINISRC